MKKQRKTRALVSPRWLKSMLKKACLSLLKRLIKCFLDRVIKKRRERIEILIREEYTCPLEIVHDIVKGKWKTLIVFLLGKGRMGLAELRRGIEGISEKMLLQQLKELREFGVVEKESFEGYPLRVEYFLTPRGEKLLEAVKIMQEIGIEYMIEHGQSEVLEKKGICMSQPIPTKK